MGNKIVINKYGYNLPEVKVTDSKTPRKPRKIIGVNTKFNLKNTTIGQNPNKVPNDYVTNTNPYSSAYIRGQVRQAEKEGFLNLDNIDTYNYVKSNVNNSTKNTNTSRTKNTNTKSSFNLTLPSANSGNEDVKTIQKRLASKGYYDKRYENADNKESTKNLQKELIRLGYLDNSNGKEIDGVYGKKTHAAYIKYLRDKEVDGIMGSKTKSALEQEKKDTTNVVIPEYKGYGSLKPDFSNPYLKGTVLDFTSKKY